MYLKIAVVNGSRHISYLDIAIRIRERRIYVEINCSGKLELPVGFAD